MKQYDYLVIGAGIAGASIAYRLAGDSKVGVLEQEGQPGYHTTGRSAAIWTGAYGPPWLRALANASIDFIHNPPEGFAEYELGHKTGILFVADEKQKPDLLGLLASVRKLSPNIHEISVEQAVERVGVLDRDYVKAAFYDPDTLGLDVNGLHQGFLRGIKSGGGDILCNAGAEAMERRDGLWHVTTQAGEFCAPIVINAAGAWVDGVAEKAGAKKIGIMPKRRTVITVDAPAGHDVSHWPVVLDCHETFYFKQAGGAILASPADETPDEPRDVQPEELDIAMAVDRLQAATNMEIRRVTSSWAGLRNFVPDGRPAVGFADDVEGFFWFAGHGGYGISTSPALGDCGAALVKGKNLPGYVRKLGLTKEAIAPNRNQKT